MRQPGHTGTGESPPDFDSFCTRLRAAGVDPATLEDKEERGRLSTLYGWLRGLLPDLEIMLVVRAALERYPEKLRVVSVLHGVNPWGVGVAVGRNDSFYVPAIARWVPRDESGQAAIIETIDLDRMNEVLTDARFGAVAPDARE